MPYGYIFESSLDLLIIFIYFFHSFLVLFLLFRNRIWFRLLGEVQLNVHQLSGLHLGHAQTGPSVGQWTIINKAGHQQY